MSYISSAGFTPKLTIVKVHIRHTNLVPEIEVKVPGICAPIYLDWQSGEPSPRRDSILGSPIVMILTNFAVCRMPDII